MKLNENVIAKIYQHALDAYPEECCGIITGNRQNQDVHFCRNIQNRLHSEDPEKYPRDARTAYTVDRNEAERIFSSARERGHEVIAFYHSHVEFDAYFSEVNKEAQTVFGEPEFPEALHIIVSVKNKKINDIKYFKWDADKRDFISLT